MPELPSASTLLELIEAQARARGSSLALLAPDRPPLGYDALLRQVERVGASLAAMGLGRGQRIAGVVGHRESGDFDVTALLPEDPTDLSHLPLRPR